MIERNAPGPFPEERRARALCGVGIFALLLGLYALTSPGRIDIIDGQFRYEVAKNLLDLGDPVVIDPVLAHHPYFTAEHSGKSYSIYNPAASVAAMPPILLSRALPGHNADRERFAFAMTGPLFGAGLGVLLFAAFTMLGLTAARAAAWSLAFCATTLWWPGSTTVFDQNQHAFFLFASVLLAWQAGRRSNYALALLAGLAGGVLFTYQENYGILLPAAALAVFAPPEEGTGEVVDLRSAKALRREGVLRYLAYGATSALGLAVFLSYNYYRFGSLFPQDKYSEIDIFGGNALAGALTYLASPGKAALLFSPPLLLAIFGAPRLFARAPLLAAAVAVVSLVHVLVMIQLVFFGGDWCWGPRYLLILQPLWALALPFAVAKVGARLAGTALAAGLLVQFMGVAVDHHRFFYENDLAPHFWLDQWTYFERSQWLSRPGEIADMVANGAPVEAVRFSSSPTGEATYCPYGPPPGVRPSSWMRSYALFYVPRPWPMWVYTLEPSRRPFEPAWLVAAAAATAAAGAGLLAAALRRRRSGEVATGLESAG